jgi:hypothetical protein
MRTRGGNCKPRRCPSLKRFFRFQSLSRLIPGMTGAGAGRALFPPPGVGHRAFAVSAEACPREGGE